MSLSRDEAVSILRAHDGAFAELSSLTQWTTSSSSAKTYTATYSDAQNASHTLIILIASTQMLETQSVLFEAISSNTSIPIPHLLKRDDTSTLISSPYALFAHPPGVPLNSSSLSDHIRAAAELRLGTQLREMHAIQNDWFGLLGEQKVWGEYYSWQEAFTLLLEIALGEVEKRGPEWLGGLPVVDLRRALGRAIGFFLFDDAEVPSLVWCGDREWDGFVFVSVDAPNEGDIVGVVGWEGALWGDPLMEGAFRSPSAALLEGYGGSPIVFARQHTKRIWYTAYAALQALLAAADAGDAEREEESRKIITEMAKKLKDTPCY